MQKPSKHSYVKICLLVGVLITFAHYRSHRPSLTWLGKEVQPNRLIERVHTYHMFDSTQKKVGSMVFGWQQEENYLVSRDTSQLDDGRIYETLEMKIDPRTMLLSNMYMHILTPNAQANIQLQRKNERILGNFEIKQDASPIVRNIDTLLSFDIIREELYALMHSIDYVPGDSLAFKMLVSNTLTILDASLQYEGEETIEVPAGRFPTDVLYLHTGGLMDNRIWMTKSEPKRIVKFFVPNPRLEIELVKTERIPKRK